MAGMDYRAVFAVAPVPMLVLAPDGVIVDANRAYERVSGRRCHELIGRPVTEMFPDNPADPAADGSTNLAASLRRVVDSGAPDTMPVQRYDVADRVTGVYAERYWSPVNVPVIDELGYTVAVLHQVEDVTEIARRQQAHESQDEAGGAQLQDADWKVHARAKELRRQIDAETDARQRRKHAREQILLGLITASTQVLSVESKLVALAGAAVPALSDVCAVYQLGNPLPAGRRPTAPIHAWRLAAPTSDGTVGPTPGRSSVWSGGDPASAAVAAAATVVVNYVPDSPPAWAAAAGVESAIRVGRVHCTALVPVVIDGMVHAFIAFGAGAARPSYNDDDREMFELIAAQTAVAMRQGGRYEQYRDTALILQRALLTDPPDVPGLEIVVRYRPADQGTEVGGDWHDVFRLAGTDETGRVLDGDLAVVVGDVAGHDVSAAAVMGQLRSMVRGFTVHNGGTPDRTLAALDHVIRQTRLTYLATAVVAHVQRPTGDPAAGMDLTWSNAGHCAPILLDEHGATTVLSGPRDAALGVFAAARRTAATCHLPRGSTLLLFSDGLFERHTLDYDESFDELTRKITATAGLAMDEFCDELLAAAPRDDDIVLVALRQR